MNDMSKLEETQNIIRNKFKKAHSNRIKSESDVNHTIQPLTAAAAAAKNSAPVDLESNNSSLQASLHSISKNNLNRASISNTIKTNEDVRDPNALCDILRILLTSLPNFGDVACMQRINAILDELRRLEIID